MELNLSELTLKSFNSVEFNLTEFTAAENLVAMVTMEHKQSKSTSKAHVRNFNLSSLKMN
jgi:hypothetical protein